MTNLELAKMIIDTGLYDGCQSPQELSKLYSHDELVNIYDCLFIKNTAKGIMEAFGLEYIK